MINNNNDYYRLFIHEIKHSINVVLKVYQNAQLRHLKQE